MSPLVRARSWVARKDNQPVSTNEKGPNTLSSLSSPSTANHSRKGRPASGNLIQRSNTPSSSPTIVSPGLPPHPTQRPSNPIGSNRSTHTAITAEQLQEMLHRHQLEMALVKQEARELKEEKAFLVAQNLRLERELCVHSRSVSSAGNGVSAEQRRHGDLKRRPSFSRSRSQPNGDHHEHLSSFSLHSPSHSASSSSSHPWPCSSGGTSTPSSHSPSYHSRNPSTASLAALASHGPQSLSRRTSLSGTGMYAPDSASSHHHGLTSRSQKVAHAHALGLTSLRPLSVASALCEEWHRAGAGSNPNSAAPSRRNSMTGYHSSDQPLKGILKPTTPIRPLSSCAGISNERAPRRSSALGYYVEEGYDSITRTNQPRSLHNSSTNHLHQIPPSSQRARRGSLDMISGDGERMQWKCRGYV